MQTLISGGIDVARIANRVSMCVAYMNTVYYVFDDILYVQGDSAG